MKDSHADLAAAVKLRDVIQSGPEHQKASTTDPSPWPEPLPLPLLPVQSPLELMPHQVTALEFAASGFRKYLALKQGLGKTAIAARRAEQLARSDFIRTVYVTPPFLVENIIHEFGRWAPSLMVMPLRHPRAHLAHVLVVPDSLIHRDGVLDWVSWCFIGARPTLVVVDEAHRFKNPDAKRTQALMGHRGNPGLMDCTWRHLYLSGTPMPNSPIELYPVLAKSVPEAIDHMTYYQYARKFCAARQTPWGLDVSGASNLNELRLRIKHPTGAFMLRMDKDVLNLPPRTEAVFYLTGKMSRELRTLDAKLSKELTPEQAVKHAIAAKSGRTGETLPLATYRRLLAKEKAKPTAEYVQGVLEGGEESILLLGFHLEAIADLEHRLAKWNPFVVTGKVPPKKRQAIVTAFQQDKHRRLFIANYVAIGVGFTLTKASRVMAMEYDWVPGVNEQAFDRTHRIGQTKPVLIEYLVYPNSLDEAIRRTLLRKCKVTDYI